MTNKVIYKLKGHEKFPLREGWINKGLSVAKEKGTHIFLESQGPDMLGVGTNMVKSIRYWMQACGLLVKDGNKEILSDMAEIIYMNDPYLEDIFSLWILHSNITKNIEQATVWYMFFNRFNVDSFNKADMQKKMQQELFNYVGQQVTESSLKDDIDVLLNMYSKGDNKNEDPEDKIISPFSTLGIIKKEDETYYKIQPDLRRIANELVLYEISSLLDHNKSISIETIASGERSNLYDALKGLQLVEAIPYTKIFKDNGYELDEESKNTVKELISSLKSEVEQLITPYLANMYCKSVEGVNTFRNHNTKMQNMLEELGFTNYAMQVKRRKEEELSNIDEIRSRQELRADCEKYLEESQITRYVTYVNVCLYLKSGKELQARVKKYGVALGKDAQKIQENINDRMAALEKNHDRTMQDMSDIWDDLYEVKNADDVEMLIDNIASVLQKGIPDADRLDFEELQKNLSELLNDINEIKRVTNSRNEFKKISEDMINKYEHSEFDFEVLPIIHEVISDMENNMNVREQEWINSVLTLGDKSRKAVHKWKEKTAYLPEYLSEETIEKVKMVDKEADEIISEGKIEDVLFYFDKLDDVEKLECIQKLQNRLNR